MTTANCRSSRVILDAKDNFVFTLTEPVYVYTDIIKPNFVRDFYVRLLPSLHFLLATRYNCFNYPLYRPVAQSFIESVTNRLVKKSGENVIFEDSDIPCLVILQFEKKSSTQ